MTEPDNTTVSASGVWENSNSDVIRAGNAMNRGVGDGIHPGYVITVPDENHYGFGNGDAEGKGTCYCEGMGEYEFGFNTGGWCSGAGNDNKTGE